MRVLLIFALMFFMVACGSETGTSPTDIPESSETEQADNEKNDEESEKIEVDKGLLNVKVTVPSSVLDGKNIDQVITEAKAAGVKEVVKNSNGSLTYKMSKSTHKKMMDELKSNSVESIEEIKNSGDFVSIKDIMHNDSFSEFTMVVDKQKYENSFDAFASLGLGVLGIYYQAFNGVDDYNVKVSIKNNENGEVFDTIMYPEAFKEFEG